MANAFYDIDDETREKILVLFSQAQIKARSEEVHAIVNFDM